MAKTIKDAIDPFFRKSFKDGTLWSRLVGLFKKHLAQRSEVDFRILESFELFKHPRRGKKFLFEVVVNVLNETIHIELFTAALFDDKYQLDKCRQTLIIIFLDANSKATTISEEITYPIESTTANSVVVKKDVLINITHKQLLQSPVPPGTKWALIAVKCDPLRKAKEKGLKFSQIEIIKAHEVKGLIS